jgi:non-reducing end alpha-L-arabinofuranosidase
MTRFGLFKGFKVMMAVILSLGLIQEKIYAANCPCDIYKSGGTPCVAAHSTVRALFSNYTGPLYQVRRQSDNKTLDIGALSPGGAADGPAQDAFCSGTPCVVTKIYDQSGKGNFLEYQGTGSSVGGKDNPATATTESFQLSGHKVYSLYIKPANSYWRNGSSSGVPLGSAPEGMYMVTSGKHYNGGCCFDYGNSEVDRKPDGSGTMDAIYFGSITSWGTGAGSGPWVMADLEYGIFSQGNGNKNQNCPSHTSTYVTAVLKNNGTTEFAIKGGNATSGSLGAYYKGALPSGWSPMKKQGAIVLGSGGDCCATNTNQSEGTFYEGAIVSGYPADSTENAIQANIVSAGYGSAATSIISNRSDNARQASPVKVSCIRSNTGAIIGYTLQHARRVSVNILDQRGRLIAAVADGIVSAGRHEAVWEAKRGRAGVYVYRVEIDGVAGWTGKIVIGK